MNQEEFLSAIKGVVSTNRDVWPETLLSDIPEWDSLSAMSVVTFLATQGLASITLSELQQARTVGDIMTMVKPVLS